MLSSVFQRSMFVWARAQQLQMTCAEVKVPFVQQRYDTCAAASGNMHSSIYARVQKSMLVRSIVIAAKHPRHGTYATL
jgi:hypothetical protein